MPSAAPAQPAVPSARPLPIPNVSFGPFRLMEAVPWLMLASAMRFLAYGSPAAAIPALIISNLSLFLAFLLAANRAIEFTDGQTSLGKLDFGEQLRIGRAVLHRVGGLLIGASLLCAMAGAKDIAPHLLMGFDGIAFDQFSKIGMIWSSALAALVLLMVVRADLGRKVELLATLREFHARVRCLLPAIVVVALFQFGLSYIQGWGRELVMALYQTDAPMTFKNLTYFVFVFGFASLRLWVTLAILTLALRESYWRGEARGLS